MTLNNAAVTETVSGLLSVSSGTFDQGATANVVATGGISVASGATYKNVGAGDITLGAGVSNAGTIQLNAGGVVCPSVGADTILDSIQRRGNAAGLDGCRDLRPPERGREGSGRDGCDHRVQWNELGQQRRQLDLLRRLRPCIGDSQSYQARRQRQRRLGDRSAWTLAVTSSNGGTGTGSAAGAEIAGTTYTLQAGKQYSVAESGGPDRVHRIRFGRLHDRERGRGHDLHLHHHQRRPGADA